MGGEWHVTAADHNLSAMFALAAVILPSPLLLLVKMMTNNCHITMLHSLTLYGKNKS